MRNTMMGAASLLAAALVLSTPAAAAPVTAISPSITTGTQNFNNLFGIDFNTNATAVVVSRLGVFDNAGDGALLTNSGTQPIVIQIWDRDTGLALATANFAGGTGNGTLETVGTGKVFFKTLAVPLTLPANGRFYVSEDYGGTEKFGNVGNAGYVAPTTDTNGGLITFVGKGRASNIHGAMYNGNDVASGGTSTAPAPPATTNGFIDSGPAARYTGPTFTYDAVPEPATAAVVGVAGAAGLLGRRRAGGRRRGRAAA